MWMSSLELRGGFPEMKAGGTEEGTLHGWEANAHFNLGVAVEKQLGEIMSLIKENHQGLKNWKLCQ